MISLSVIGFYVWPPNSLSREIYKTVYIHRLGMMLISIAVLVLALIYLNLDIKLLFVSVLYVISRHP